jgi:micrococcal nuclease
MPKHRLLIAGLLALPLGGCEVTVVEDSAGGSTTAQVTRVVDGDTIKVSVDGRSERVRYIGMDTPESVKPGSPVECYGKAASELNDKLVGGRTVTLSFDVERRDRYGRLLAYVRRASDGLFVNEELVRRGYATTLTIPPNVRYASRFQQLQREARSASRGLWGACGR